ncbi:MAG: 3,4-dihydroxy-2-butanone-4-phosphate synthase [Euryarchaeota archaeon]|nr:3,4-dihydroxy-2-butanone-4-phosphate synthase [Euryarchaeota archaeon]
MIHRNDNRVEEAGVGGGPSEAGEGLDGAGGEAVGDKPADGLAAAAGAGAGGAHQPEHRARRPVGVHHQPGDEDAAAGVQRLPAALRGRGGEGGTGGPGEDRPGGGAVLHLAGGLHAAVPGETGVPPVPRDPEPGPGPPQRAAAPPAGRAAGDSHRGVPVGGAHLRGSQVLPGAGQQPRGRRHPPRPHPLPPGCAGTAGPGEPPAGAEGEGRGRGAGGGIPVKNPVEQAVDRLRQGRFVLLFDADDREGETDIVQAARFTSPKDVSVMRREAGGLICVAMHPEASERLGLPYMADVLRQAQGPGSQMLKRAADLRLDYDERSSFSLWVNHRETRTGITDNDRARTIRELARAAEDALRGEKVDFAERFRSPGHVSICRGAPGLLAARRGQTELSLALAEMADLPPAMVMCEMLDHRTGKALPKKDAANWGRRRGYIYLEGAQVVEAWETSPSKR